MPRIFHDDRSVAVKFPHMHLIAAITKRAAVDYRDNDLLVALGAMFWYAFGGDGRIFLTALGFELDDAGIFDKLIVGGV